MQIINLENIESWYDFLPAGLIYSIGESKFEILQAVSACESIDDLWDLFIKMLKANWLRGEIKAFSLEQELNLLKYEVIFSLYTSLKCKLESGKGRKDFIDEIVKHEPDFMEMHKHGFASQYEFDSFRKRPNARESSEGEEWSKTRKSVLNRLNKVKIENFPDAFSIPTPELYYYLNQCCSYNILGEKEEKDKYRFFYSNANILYMMLKFKADLPFTSAAKCGMYLNHIYEATKEVFKRIELISKYEDKRLIKVEEAFIWDHLLSFSNLDLLSDYYIKNYTNLSDRPVIYTSAQRYDILYYYQVIFKLPYILCKRELKSYDDAIKEYVVDNDSSRIEPIVKKYIYIDSCLIPTLQTVFLHLLRLYTCKSCLNDKKANDYNILERLKYYVNGNLSRYSYYEDLCDSVYSNLRLKDYDGYLKKMGERVNRKKENTDREYQKQIQFYISHFFYFSKHVSYMDNYKIYSKFKSSSGFMKGSNLKLRIPFIDHIQREWDKLIFDVNLPSDKNDFPASNFYYDFKRKK